MMEKCEFHKKIGMELELIAHEHSLTTLQANDIDCGSFVPTMLLILGMNNSLTQDFIEESKEYIGLTYNEIDPNRAEALFIQFKSLLDKGNC